MLALPNNLIRRRVGQQHRRKSRNGRIVGFDLGAVMAIIMLP